MVYLILRRCVTAVPMILLITFVVFIMVRVAVPGDPALVLAGERATPQMIEQIRINLGLDKPVLTQFVTFLGNAVQGDLGRSVKFGEPVRDVVLKAFPYTVALTLLSVAFGVVVGVTVGVVSAARANTWIDSVALSGTTLFYSVPTFWLALMLTMLFAVRLHWLPVQGADSWRHFVLPVVTLGVGEASVIARLTRSSMGEALGADYIRTSRAKGLPERLVLTRHALRNGLLPVITVGGLSIGALLGGAVIVESIFGLPGVGRLAVEGIHNRDYPMVQGTVLLVAISFIVANLVVDVLYAVVDPRIRYR